MAKKQYIPKLCLVLGIRGIAQPIYSRKNDCNFTRTADHEQQF